MRYKISDIDSRLVALNSIIKPTGRAVIYGRRYGYNALDLVSLSDKMGEVLRTVASGMTIRETVNMIDAMLTGISLASR